MTIEEYNEPNYKDLFSRVLGKNTDVFDPPGLFHVGQREWPQGNCHEHHIQLREAPCTSLEQCERNNEVRAEKYRQDNNIKRRPRMTEKEKKRLDHWTKEHQRFEDFRWGVY